MDAIVGGIELTGTLYTSAQGDAKDKLAMAEQIYDSSIGKHQSTINAEFKNAISGGIGTPHEAITSEEINNTLTFE